MLNARRSQPTPLDFDYALSEFNLPLSFLEPHLRPPIPQSRLKIQLESETSEQDFNSQLFLLGPELSGEPDKKAKRFVPDRFPSFPSKHTYKYTDKESARETDPRKIREEAAKAARQGEDALRRLNRVSKAGKEKDIKKAAQQDPGSKERHKLFEETIASLVNGNQQTMTGRSDEDQTLVVNAQSIYFRKAVPKKKQVEIPADTIRVEI
jgi:transcription initiation factor TFIID subunit 8